MRGPTTTLVTTPAAAEAGIDPGPFVSLTTDLGPTATAICAGVVSAIAPRARVLTVSSSVPAFSIRAGALELWYALPCLPIGVHVAVVDPGVGTARRPVAIATVRGDVLVGPDNGVLGPAAGRLGGIASVHLLEAEPSRLPGASATFQGRDIFAPAAGHLASGGAISALGPTVDRDSLIALDWPAPAVEPGELAASIVLADDFGNLYLAAEAKDAESAFGRLAWGTPLVASWVAADGGARSVRVTWAETFGAVEVGGSLLHVDHDGRLDLAVNRGSAADVLGARVDDRLRIARA